jgi:hypothetical protein
MSYSPKAERAVYRHIHLRYAESDIARMEEIKKVKGLSWEDLVFYAVMNIKVKGGKDKNGGTKRNNKNGGSSL